MIERGYKSYKMDLNNKKKGEEEYSIDIIRLLRNLWHRAWVIVLATVIAGGAAFVWSSYMIAPRYSSSIMMYVNTSSISLGSTSLSLGELNAAQSLVKTYIVILKSRTTLEKVISEAELDYTYNQLLGMISASDVDNTEIFRITVTSGDPYEAAKIANCIAEILPVRVADTIDGCSMRLVDGAIVETAKKYPSITGYTERGMIIGFVFSCLILIVIDLFDDVIRDEDYIIQKYDIPVLTRVPNLLEENSSKYYYKGRHSYNIRKENDGSFE